MEEKKKLQDIITEIDNLKKYNSELGNNVSGKTLEDYVNKIERDINEIQKVIDTTSNHSISQ